MNVLKYLKFLLYPFSLLYGLVMWLRNRLYDNKVLTAVEFDLPVIAVGNLSMGGTGKTPHVEYLIKLLQDSYPVATLSRGYQRSTRGYVLANDRTTANDIGDEPMQFHRKFPGIKVCVGEERMLAIPQLVGDAPDTQVILLDDAFQHRSVKPGLNILITDYSRRFTKDHVVPFGYLREGRKGYRRANIIIVSKCPPELDQQDMNAIRQEIAPLPGQQVYFTCLQYGQLYDLFSGEPFRPADYDAVLLVAGIARPEPLLSNLQQLFPKVYLLPFPDHYYYSVRDLEKVRKELDDLPGARKLIITTEKDAVRLHLLQSEIEARQLSIGVMPIEISFLDNAGDSFNNYIFDYIAHTLISASAENNA
ncbi:lipid-A-disaccharide kinase [Chitinophaga costaii]|uniref:Tetraacyldisaccharide 4'-kinase n=1 Tax=Chitinophaga costaii TaxID=1335309 RepID=A0A1C4G460_9BACT|nr:tetraacyldisaccharide 4'-kinase [Chitinophaga costaii]PUZ20973.1 tetraacyldisaccharide 4'-kinase [Chitinophaga costaii]SCC62655.1 lipid-A-disaccharide kinase [Chitinophaga costaii]